MVVLGEFIVHCPERAVRAALSECKRVSKEDGRLVLTFSYDRRPKKGQHPDHLLVVWDEEYQVTSWHQSAWTSDLFEPIVNELGLKSLKKFS